MLTPESIRSLARAGNGPEQAEPESWQQWKDEHPEQAQQIDADFVLDGVDLDPIIEADVLLSRIHLDIHDNLVRDRFRDLAYALCQAREKGMQNPPKIERGGDEYLRLLKAAMPEGTELRVEMKQWYGKQNMFDEDGIFYVYVDGCVEVCSFRHREWEKAVTRLREKVADRAEFEAWKRQREAVQS